MEISITDTVLQKLHLVTPGGYSCASGNPELAYLDSRLRLARLGSRWRVQNFLPISMIGYFNQSNKDISPSARYGGIQAGITIPLFFGAQKGKIESARLNEKIAANNINYQHECNEAPGCTSWPRRTGNTGEPWIFMKWRPFHRQTRSSARQT